MSPSLQRDTRELIEHLRSKRRRRRNGRALLWGVGSVLALAAIIAGVVLATSAISPKASGSTVASVSGGSGAGKATTTTMKATLVTPAARVAATKTSTPATVHPVTSTTSAPATTSTTNWLTAKVVVIDPGHQAHADSALEPIGPGSSTRKAKVSSGTFSPTTGTPESAVALAVGLKLQDALKAQGIQVIMVRTTEDVDISNIQRAQISNQAKADLTIRLHCDGSPDRSNKGFLTLYPASIKGWTDDIAAASKQAATIIQRDAVVATGAQDRGLAERSDLTGFNWSDVPVALVEMGFMTNAAEDKRLESGAYQDLIVQGLTKGIVEFLSANR
jgi:N-acetylmuramoyl-L-alanine amidase